MNKISLTIRKAVPGDAPAIMEIMRESFGRYIKDAGIATPVEALCESCDDIIKDMTAQEVYIALVDDVPVGSIRVRILPDGTAYINRFGVRFGYRNMGIGKSLLQAVDDLLTEKGIYSVSLHTAAKHSELIRFYYGLGFYIDSTARDRGYIRALMVKEYSP